MWYTSTHGKFQTYFGLKLSVLNLSITEQLSIILQRMNTNANDSFVAVCVTIQSLTRHRNDEIFETLFELVKYVAEEI